MRTILFAILTLVACKAKDKPAPEPGSASAAAAADAPPAVDAPAVDAPPAIDAMAFDPGELSTPESVLYDAGRDMYVVANINGAPDGADDNGFLTVVNPDGSNERANANWKWIDGSAPDIKLDAPKGMAISGDTLWVADITVVRRFAAKAGIPKPDVVIPGAAFLNDVTPDGAGGVFVSDTAADVIHHIDKDGKATPRAKGKALRSPNGLWSDGKTLWVVTRTGEMYEVDAKGKQGAVTKLPTAALDGIVGLEGGEFLVSSWEGKCVYRGKPGGEWTVVVKDIQSPADIDYDPKRKRLLIPGFETNQLHLHAL